MNNLKGSNFKSLKEINRAMIIETIYKHGPISRSRIANITSLTPATISTNISKLINKGFVKELSYSSSKRKENAVGRPPILLDIVSSSRYVIGVERAYRGVTICLSDIAGNCLDSVTMKPDYSDINNLLSIISDNIHILISSHNIDKALIIGIGMALPGFIDSEKNTVIKIPHQDLKGIDIVSKLSELTDLKVVVENHVRAMALAEALLTKKNRPSLFAYYFISGGIGCSLMLNNNAISGGLSGASEIGHTIVDPNGPRCSCGNYGCLEAFAGEESIKANIRNVLKEETNTSLHDYISNHSNPKVCELVDCAISGDKISNELLSQIIKHLAISIINTINFINPTLIILDGEIFSTKYVQNRLLAIIKDNLFSLNRKGVKFEFKKYDKTFGSTGGVAVAIKKIFINQD